MNLAELQRQVMGLVKGTYRASERDDPYIQDIARSPHLELVREIVLWWRAYHLERYCVLTARLLKKKRIFEETVGLFVSQARFSPFIEAVSVRFLEEMGRHRDGLVASVAQFELAMIKVKKGDNSEYTIDWMHNPEAVLDSLLTGAPLDEGKSAVQYRILVSGSLPSLFQIAKLDAQGFPLASSANH